MAEKKKAKQPSLPERSWHLIDAGQLPLGRLAVKISNLLCGKGKVSYRPNLDEGDYVVVVNALGLVTTGNKNDKKTYYRYSGYPGGLRAETLGSLRTRKPEEVVRLAVAGMLPKNKLIRPRLARLYIYKGLEHPHAAQMERKNNYAKS